MSDEPVAQQQQTGTNTGYLASEQQFEQNTNAITTKTKKEKAKPKAEPIKLKIKTNARLKNDPELGQHTEEPETFRGRSTRRTTPQHTVAVNAVEENVPLPGTANYELYRTLTESPTNKSQFDQQKSHYQAPNPSNQSISPEYQQFASPQLSQAHIQQSPEADAQNINTNSDTERGILPKKRRGRNKTKFEANQETVAEEPVQKKQRGRRKHDDQLPEVTETQPTNEVANIPTENSTLEEVTENYPKKRITAAAKKQYKDEKSFAVEQPNLSPPPVQFTPPNEDINSEPVTNRRGRKAKTKVNQNTVNADQMSQPEVSQRPTRTTRHTANGNMTKVSSELSN